jgi:hypothetical protein
MKNTQDKISEICNNLNDFLIEKNKRYGDSALNPLGVFSKLSAREGICVRLDDKLKRIKNNTSKEIRKNDVVDIIGYLILYCVEQDWLSFDEFLD